MTTTAKITAILLSFSILLTMSCSDDSGTDSPDVPQTVSGTIGPTGGTLEIPGVISLDVPVGALSLETDFTITRNDSPPDPDGTLGPVSSDYTIEPSGTDFSVPAEITLAYDPSDMGGGQEHEITLYTHDGSSWSALTTQGDTAANTASADIVHLSDFCAMVDTSLALQGDVYAKWVLSMKSTGPLPYLTAPMRRAFRFCRYTMSPSVATATLWDGMMISSSMFIRR